MSGGYFAGPYFGGAAIIATPVLALAPVIEGLERQRIIAALQDIMAAGPYYAAVYGDDDKPVVDEDVEVVPASIVANEVKTLFRPARFNRRTRLQERISWPFMAIVQFDAPHETTIEAWEQRMQTPVVLPETTDAGGRRLRQATILYQDAAYQHPPRGGQSPTGSRIVANFEIELSPL